MAKDSTFEFERRRNVPVRYNRELMEKTLQVMRRVQEIKARRELAFWKARMKVKQKIEKQQALEAIRTGTHLLVSSLAVNHPVKLIEQRTVAAMEKAKNKEMDTSESS